MSVVFIVALALTVSACGGSSSSSSSGGGGNVTNSKSATGTGTKVKGGVAKFAQQPNSSPNYIFPLTSGEYYTISTVSQFQYVMYRPLYWYFGTGKIAFNQSLSLAKPPVYSNGNRTVTIHLNDWKWSDGTPITSRDVEFWMNLVKANKEHWAAYSPGKFPDNIVGEKYPDSKTVVFTLDKAYNPDFFTGNELTQITPLPQHVWDKTSTSGKVGDADRTKAGAVEVFEYLDGQSQELSSYSTNPLWQVVSGAWRLKQYRTDGFVELTPNPNYSGPVKPTLSAIQLLPFTSASAEFNVLRQGGLDYGYVPIESISQASYLESNGFAVLPWVGWSINYIPYNMTNPKTGPLFKQLYFRQAIQHLVDQEGIAKSLLKGYGYTSYGPVPVKPDNDLVGPEQLKNPYPYDPEAAIDLLESHGWTVTPNGVSTCTDPGSGPSQCGAGVPAGAKASFDFLYTSGQLALEQESEVLQGDLSKAGIQLNLKSAPYGTVLTDAAPCAEGQPCKWDLAYWGNGWVFAPYPSGEIMFASSGGYNVGGYSNPTNDKNIDATLTSTDPNVMQKYGDFLAKDLPAIWFPVPYYQVSAVKKTLGGVSPQDPGLTIDPSSWYLTE